IGGSAGEIEVDVLLPEAWGTSGVEVVVDGAAARNRVRTVESSRYATVALTGPAAQSVRIRRSGG
ncbi:MAG: hypothetical protein ACOC2D_18965, partial [Spirochaetota bacterium]